MSSVNIVAIEGALVYGLDAYEPTCTPLVTPLILDLSKTIIHIVPYSGKLSREKTFADP